MDKKTIEKNFSRCARLYDNYAGIQRFSAARLIGLTYDTGAEFKNILEIGCGTGNYTVLLQENFQKATIKAIDISGEMVKLAKRKAETGRVEFVIADAEEMDLPGAHDLITSNVSLQWFEDMESSIERYRKALEPGGVISFSVFGPFTFLELKKALREAMGRESDIDSSSFLDRDELDTLMNRCFKRSVVEEFTIKESYSSLKELIRKIKYTGARGSTLKNNLLWKKDMLNKAERAYMTIFGAIEATYQLFFCKGEVQ